MKKEDFKKLLKLKYLGVLGVIAFMGVGIIWAYDDREFGYLSPAGSTKTIPADVYYGPSYPCKNVVNTGGLGSNYFVPTKTVEEWQAFTGNLPSGIALTACCTNGYKDYDKDGYGIDPYGCHDTSSSYNIVQAYPDCADGFSYIFPGNTGTDMTCTYSSTCAGFYGNNDNGGEHNCDATLSKGFWQGPATPVAYPSSSPLPGSLYYRNASGVYVSVTGSGTCGTLYGPTGSWYTGTSGVYTVAFFGQAQVKCR